MTDSAPDSGKRTETRLEDPRWGWSPWVGPIVSAVIIVVGGGANLWLASTASSNKELVEAYIESVNRQIENMDKRQDRLEDRLIYLEQNRYVPTAGQPSKTTASDHLPAQMADLAGKNP